MCEINNSLDFGEQPKVDPPSGRYELVSELGVGGFSVVYLARHTRTGQAYAIKFVAISSLCRRTINEAANHWNLRHPHIVEIKEVFTTSDALAMVMEYYPGGNLFNCIQKQKRLTEGCARWIFQQLVFAVDYMHRRGVANRDIKLENILLDGSPRPLIKLCDFGLSKHRIFESEPRSQVGTTNYLSPEMLANINMPYDGQCADVWACGVVLYAMLVGQYPFQPQQRTKDHLKVLLQRIAAVEYTIPTTLYLSSDEARDMNDICFQGLNFQGVKQRRQSIQEVLSILENTDAQAFNSRNLEDFLDMRMHEDDSSWLAL